MHSNVFWMELDEVEGKRNVVIRVIRGLEIRGLEIRGVK